MNSLFIIDSVLLLLLFIDLKENDDLFDIQEERFLKAIKSVRVKKFRSEISYSTLELQNFLAGRLSQVDQSIYLLYSYCCIMVL